jgi:type I restriction enzyme S subunit
MIASIPVYVPDELTLNKFNELSEAIQKQIEVSKGTIACATEARDRLLPKLMSGEIEV